MPVDVDCLMPVGPGSQPWAHEAARSVLHQRDVRVRLIVVLDQRWELPDSLTGIDELSEVVVVRNLKTPGVAGALNTGLEVSQTPVVARMDSDDVAAPDRLRCQLEVMENSLAIVVGSHIHYFQNELAENWLATESEQKACGYTVVDPSSLMIANIIAHPTVLMDRTRVLAVGGYNERARRVEDYDLWMRLCLDGPIAIANRTLVAVRGHDQQHSRGRPVFRDQWILAQTRRTLSKEMAGQSWPGVWATARYHWLHAWLALGRIVR